MEDNKQPESSVQQNTETIFNEDELTTIGYDKHIRQARNTLFIAAGILFINAIIFFAKYPLDIEVMWLDYLLWTIYIGGFIALGFYSNKKPYTAIIGGLILMIAFIVINALIEPMTILSGIIFKIAVFVYLTKGLNDAKYAQQVKEQLGQR
jgi:hypothetical protein